MSGARKKSPHDHTRHAVTLPGMAWRRALFLLLLLATTLLGAQLMADILLPNGLTVLEGFILALFVVTFAWIAQAFWNAVMGFVIQLLRLDPLSLRRLPDRSARTDAIAARTAVIMPVYNEDTQRVMAGFESNLRSLAQTGELAQFDFFLLSDSQQADIISAEARAWTRLRQRLGALASHAHYRRREKNSGRKVGNIEDFCARWGHQYDFMIVLDADSIMSGNCMLELVRTLQANPRAGLVQTVPIPVRQQTLFGRFLQFASALYSPMLATGMAFWQGDAANYWGHNAIIRIRPFMEHCKLPRLPCKRGPFSGEILSHDFVEAAMMRRAGWQVLLRADLGGSYEELPSNLLDYATRDRRWAQGNLQHLALLGSRGFHGVSRLHLLFGAVAYLSSLVWMLMLVASTVDAIQRALNSNQFFTQRYQLFPDWPIAKPEQILSLMLLTVALLLLPKLMGLILGLIQRRKEFGGALALTVSALLETLFAILLAPLMMVIHSYFVVCILTGSKVNWNAQPREGRMVPWREALQRTWLTTLAAMAWGGITWYFSPLFFWWLTPVILGMVLAAPIVRFTSSLELGQGLQSLHLLLVPTEVRPGATLALLDTLHPTRTAPALPPSALAAGRLHWQTVRKSL